MPHPTANSAENDAELKTLADVLDTRFRGPFGFRFGLDGLLGLIPGLGDVITNVMGAYIIIKATWLGYPGSVIARMFLNFCFDNLLESIPVVGNIIDFFFKSNSRNVRLMQAYQREPQLIQRRSFYWTLIVVILLVFVTGVLILGSAFLTYKTMVWLFNSQPGGFTW